MKNEEEDIDPKLVVFGVLATGVAALSVKQVLKNRKKRKKVNEWKSMNLECINNSHKRLTDLIESPDFKLSEFVEAYNEESKFLNILFNQPKS